MDFELNSDLTQEEREQITTIEQAQEVTLKKWEELKGIAILFFSRSDNRCGFCFYTENKAGGFKCKECPVRAKCKQINLRLCGFEEELDEFIHDVIGFVKGLEVEG